MKAQYYQIQTVLGNTDQKLLSHLADFGYRMVEGGGVGGGRGGSMNLLKKKNL